MRNRNFNMKMRYTLLVIFLLIIISFYFFQTPEKEFEEIYPYEDSVLTSLLSFRKVKLKKIENNGNTWEYYYSDNGGKEETILFIHGTGGAYDIWWQQIESLKDKYNIISITLPPVNTLRAAAEGLVEVLDYEKIAQTHVVGTSMGGYIAQDLMYHYPSRISKAVLGNTFPPNDIYKKENKNLRIIMPLIPEWVIMYLFRENVSEKIIPASENSKLVESYLHEQYYGYMSKKQIIGRFDIVLEYFELKQNPETETKMIPKLIIESDNDPLINEVLREKIKILYPEAEVFVFHEKGHFPYLNQAQKYAQVLDLFFRK